jgi:hypothetical protein
MFPESGMSLDPTLIIQMQRMGDLVMAFPLMAWLRRMEPERPIWVVAEKRFYEVLLPVAPDVVFFDAREAGGMCSTRYHRVINLSHRPEASELAGRMPAPQHLGATDTDGVTHIMGAWHLYRASIVQNNRHNRLHWSDLAALDVVAPHLLSQTVWPAPRPPRTRARVGLFLGASETAKRPNAAFWAELARQLLRRDISPVLLGGPEEQALARAVAEDAGIVRSNLAGRFTLEKFAVFLSHLDLLVTPDTGPMHVGAWVRALTLNLSMGPVNPWETAPAAPGHLVLRAQPSCTGCWHCTHHLPASGTPACHALFAPKRVAALIHATLRGSISTMDTPDLHVLRTERDGRGLFVLRHADGNVDSVRDRLGDFWRESFLALLGWPTHDLGQAAAAVRGHTPRLFALLVHVAGQWLRLLRRDAPASPLWMSAPPLARPLAGYLQMEMANAGGTPRGRERALELIRTFLAHLAAI